MISKNLKKRSLTSILLFILILLIFYYDILLVYSLIVLGVLSYLEFCSTISKVIKNNFYLLAIYTSFAAYITAFCYCFIFFSSMIQLKYYLYIFLLGCVFSDIGGYIFGKIFGGPKLTNISPKKTISGAIGSLIFTSLIISISVFIIFNMLSFKTIILGLLTSLACQLGDLFFSYLKRKAKLKDYGNYLPGHGGVLDRLDGILFGLPVGLISLIIMY